MPATLPRGFNVLLKTPIRSPQSAYRAQMGLVHLWFPHRKSETDSDTLGWPSSPRLAIKCRQQSLRHPGAMHAFGKLRSRSRVPKEPFTWLLAKICKNHTATGFHLRGTTITICPEVTKPTQEQKNDGRNRTRQGNSSSENTTEKNSQTDRSSQGGNHGQGGSGKKAATTDPWR